MKDGAARLSELLESSLAGFGPDQRLLAALEHTCGCIIAGSLPLYFACDSREVCFWHRQARKSKVSSHSLCRNNK